MKKYRQEVLDEIVLPVISFLTIVAGVMGVFSFFGSISAAPLALLAFITSALAIPAGILLAKYRHLGWLMTLIVIAVSEFLILISHISVNDGLDPIFFLTFTIFYCLQAYYLIVRRDLFQYPTFHPKHRPAI